MEYEVIQVQKGSEAKKLLADYKDKRNMTFTVAIENAVKKAELWDSHCERQNTD